MNIKLKLKRISLSVTVEMIDKIQSLIYDGFIISISEFYRHAIRWFLDHPLPYKQLIELGSVPMQITTVMIIDTQFEALTVFLNKQPRRINRSEFLRYIAPIYYHEIYEEKPVNDTVINQNPHQIQFSDGTIKQLITKVSKI
jgi:hypothetical protein